MDTNLVQHSMTVAVHSGTGERRKNPRFDMHFSVFLRVLGDPWTVTETADISATGAFFVTDRPFLLNTPIEYVLTFPQELTKAVRPLRVRFFGSVLRCERLSSETGEFGVAVRNTAHRYLTPDESLVFEALEQRLSPGSSRPDHPSDRRTGT
jgi:hypothetical protein